MTDRLHLSRVRLEQFRRFRRPLEIAGLEPGLNILYGPQETGKSTVAMALRAAFLERFTSSVHTDFRPDGDSGAVPAIELDFTFKGTPYALSKSFLQRGRCDLRIGTSQRLEGAKAEDLLAELFGFRFSHKGKNDASNHGIPGLLWVQQGTAPALAEPIKAAANRLTMALQTGLSDLASSSGDAVIEKVRRERAELLTDTGQLRKGGELQVIVDEVERLTQEHQTVCLQVDTYRSRVEQLAEVRPVLVEMQRERPWERFRAQALEAGARLKAVEQQQANHQQHIETIGRIERQISSLRTQLDQAEAAEQDLIQARARAENTRQSLAAAQESLAGLQIKEQHARQSRTASLELLTAARLHQRRSELSEQLHGYERTIATLIERISSARSRGEEATQARRDAELLALKREDFNRLRVLDRELSELRATLAGAATRLQYRLQPGVEIPFGGQQLSAKGVLQVTDTTQLDIPGIGELLITPGGDELPEMRLQLERLEEESRQLCLAMDVVSYKAAELRAERYRDANTKAEQAEARLRDLAPAGIDSLERDLVLEQDRAKATRTSLDVIAERAIDAPALPSVFDAERETKDVESALEVAMSRKSEAQREVDQLQGQVDQKTSAINQAEARINDPARTDQLEQWRADLVGAQGELKTLTASAKELAVVIAQACPDEIDAEIDRFTNSEKYALKRLDELKELKIRLETELQGNDAVGLDERCAEIASRLGTATRREVQLRRRAAALDHLLKRLTALRSNMTQRLMAPLQVEISPYLEALLPGSQPQLTIEESLQPSVLSRVSTAAGSEHIGYSQLSHGTQEQLALICRLAYAGLLCKQGSPALLMLDDTLVHSDRDRLERMKRVLLMASRKHQILLFSCHPERWDDCGAPMLNLKALAAA